MEKQSVRRTSGFITRLLILLSLIFFLQGNIFSSELPYEEIKKLQFKALENQDFYTDRDIRFELHIPNVSPLDVQILQSSEKSKSSFKSMKKFEDFAQGGTKIQIWFSFDKKGTYTLDPLKIMIQNRTAYIKFESVEIKDDPEKMMPRIVLVFSNGTKIASDDILKNKPVFTAETGEKIKFTLYLQYISQLVQFNFDIPKDSIYNQTKTYEITEIKYREKTFSDDLIPVADFEWTGLTPGIQPIPKFKLTVISYGGYRSELMLPEFKINFLQSQIKESEKVEEGIFTEAFEEPFIESTMPKKVQITKKHCEKLAELYSAERKSIFSGKAKKERMDFEEKLGIPSSKIICPLGLLYFSIITTLLLVFLLILSIRKKALIKVFVISGLLFLSGALLIFTTTKRLEKSGISTGSAISSIPEETAQSSSELCPGNIVKITEETDQWYHIQMGQTTGWCKKENIIIIK